MEPIQDSMFNVIVTDAEGTNSPDGVMTISLQLLRKNFEAIFFEESKKSAN